MDSKVRRTEHVHCNWVHGNVLLGFVISIYSHREEDSPIYVQKLLDNGGKARSLGSLE